MEMQMEFIRKLPNPQDLKEEFPVTDDIRRAKEERDREIADILTGKSDKFLLIIGPCSADREDAVLDYMNRPAKVQEKVKDKLFFIPRVYTNNLRTKGIRYKGMLHQPDPEKEEDMLAGIIAIRQLHTDVARETGFTCAEEMLYPENHRYLSDLLSYVAVGAIPPISLSPLWLRSASSSIQGRRPNQTLRARLDQVSQKMYLSSHVEPRPGRAHPCERE